MIRLALLIALIASPAWGQAVVVSACGTANYSSAIGQLKYLTMNPSGYLCATTGALTNVEEKAPPAPKPQPQEPKK
jgi:hypothetical protein